jgi:hypothetical protein
MLLILLLALLPLAANSQELHLLKTGIGNDGIFIAMTNTTENEDVEICNDEDMTTPPFFEVTPGTMTLSTVPVSTVFKDTLFDTVSNSYSATEKDTLTETLKTKSDLTKTNSIPSTTTHTEVSVQTTIIQYTMSISDDGHEQGKIASDMLTMTPTAMTSTPKESTSIQTSTVLIVHTPPTRHSENPPPSSNTMMYIIVGSSVGGLCFLTVGSIYFIRKHRALIAERRIQERYESMLVQHQLEMNMHQNPLTMRGDSSVWSFSNKNLT